MAGHPVDDLQADHNFSPKVETIGTPSTAELARLISLFQDQIGQPPKETTSKVSLNVRTRRTKRSGETTKKPTCVSPVPKQKRSFPDVVEIASGDEE